MAEIFTVRDDGYNLLAWSAERSICARIADEIESEHDRAVRIQSEEYDPARHDGTTCARVNAEDTSLLVCGRRVQIDHSGGQGHCWRDTGSEDVPASIREEIEGEMIDGKQETCTNFVASNGQHYRW